MTRCQNVRFGTASAYKCLTYSAQSHILSVWDLTNVKTVLPGHTISFDTVLESTKPSWSFRTAFPTHTLSTAYGSSAVPSDYFNALRKGFPACGGTINITCVPLSDAARGCWDEPPLPGPPACYCPVLARTNCHICESSPADRNLYLQSTMDVCSNLFPVYSNITWIERDRRKDAVWMDMQPFSWTVHSSDSTTLARCPNNSAKLASFATINILVGISALVLGRRTIVKKISCGMLGHAESPW